jgi:tetratricopeptide (TPR) repeat protein
VPNKAVQNGGFPAPIGIICGPNHSKPSTGGTENGGMPSGAPAKASYSPVKPEGLRASADARRGNIIAVGESLLIKRMLASNDPEEVKNAGNDQYKKGNFAEALSLYDRAVSLAPNRASYRSNRAATLIGLGRLLEAYQECEESLKLDPLYVRAQQRLVSLCIR